MTTRREYVQGLITERAYRVQVGKSTSDVDAELSRYADGPLGELIEAAVPDGISKPKRAKPAKKTAAPAASNGQPSANDPSTPGSQGTPGTAPAGEGNQS